MWRIDRTGILDGFADTLEATAIFAIRKPRIRCCCDKRKALAFLNWLRGYEISVQYNY